MQANSTINLLEQKSKFLEEFNIKDKDLSKDQKSSVVYAKKVSEGMKILEARDFFEQLDSRKGVALAQEGEKKEQDETISKEVERVALEHAKKTEKCIEIFEKDLKGVVDATIDKLLTDQDEWSRFIIVDQQGIVPFVKITMVIKKYKSKRREMVVVDVPFNFMPEEKYLTEDEKKLTEEEFVYKKFRDEFDIVMKEIEKDIFKTRND